MSWLTKAGIGISKLSELEIDANKDWQAKEIQNIKAIVGGMAEGDIAYRGPSVLEKLSGEYGVGYNFLHMKNTGAFTPEWRDIQDIIIYLTGAVNRMIAPPTLQIPKPAIGVAVAEAHSGGGHTAGKTLTIPSPPAISVSEIAVFDQRYESGDDGDLSIYGVNWEAQTFTINAAHDIEIIEIKCRRVGNPGNITIGIRATAADLPTGADLTSVTFDGNALPTSDIWIVRYVTAYSLLAATKYAMVIRAPSGDAANYLVWRSDGTAPGYAGGARCHSTNSGASWSEDVNSDFMFREGEVK
jgi:hypothetical protein